MATFASKVYNAARYQAFRPTYPLELYSAIYHYHTTAPLGGSMYKAVDLGCGTGQVSRTLAGHFIELIGVDPSSAMIETAIDITRKSEEGNVAAKLEVGNLRFVQSSAEEHMSLLDDNSVDLITAGQAAHWFDLPRLWPEMGRVLRPYGTVAFWCYPPMLLSKPRQRPLNKLIHKFASDPPPDGLGPFWEQPGTNIIWTHMALMPLPGPPFDLTSMKRISYSRPHDPSAPPYIPSQSPDAQSVEITEQFHQEDVLLNMKVTWEELEGWLRTWSAVYRYWEKYPEDKTREDGDLVHRFVEQLKAKVISKGGKKEFVELDQPMDLFMVRKSA